MSHLASPLDLGLLKRLQPLSVLSDESLREAMCLADQETFVRGIDPLSAHDWLGRMVYLMRGELKVDAFGGRPEILVGGSGRALSPVARRGYSPLATQAITDIDMIGFAEDPLDVLLTWEQIARPQGLAEADAEINPAWRHMPGMFAVHKLAQGVFAALPPAHIASLLQRFVRRAVKRGDVIVAQGDPGDYYYIIERGRCKVTRTVAGLTVPLAELAEGDAFGEDALVAESHRNATVVMDTDGVLLRLAREDFNRLLRAPLLQRIQAQDVHRLAAKSLTWIDVRFPAEFRQNGHPGAVNIPVNEIRHAMETLDPTREYIIYCQTGRRSSAAAFLLAQRGFKATLLEGGLNALAELPEKNV